MRRVTFYFLCAEVLDIITTIIGLRFGLVEINPLLSFGWERLILFKLLAILMVTIILEKKRPSRYDIIIPCVAIISVIWNSIMLLMI
jgi:hypothetical protein